MAIEINAWNRHAELFNARLRTPSQRRGAPGVGWLAGCVRIVGLINCTSLISMSYPCEIVSPIPCNPSLFFKTSVGRLAL